jgi:hypothetical protein
MPGDLRLSRSCLVLKRALCVLWKESGINDFVPRPSRVRRVHGFIHHVTRAKLLFFSFTTTCQPKNIAGGQNSIGPVGGACQAVTHWRLPLSHRVVGAESSIYDHTAGGVPRRVRGAVQRSVPATPAPLHLVP